MTLEQIEVLENWIKTMIDNKIDDAFGRGTCGGSLFETELKKEVFDKIT